MEAIVSGQKVHTHHDDQQKKALCDRLVRIEGQVRGVKKMVESDVYCEDVLVQLSSIKSALNGVIMILFESHARHCIAPSLPDNKDDSILELTRLVKKMIG